MADILNIAAYRFVPLQDLPGLRLDLQELGQRLGLRGTVLLAPEGINVFLAGPAQAVRQWLETVRSRPEFHGLHAKESLSDHVPFRKLRVRIKREIIRMDLPMDLKAVAPAQGRAPSVTARELRRWLDQGHDDEGVPVVMLDTRNGFEVEAGRFANTLAWPLGKFSDFPQALREHAHELQGKTVVSYCTGGIRCEKAALLMQQVGVERVRQLEGGILQYFEDIPDAPHWQGRCVVFDDRESLDTERRPLAQTA